MLDFPQATQLKGQNPSSTQEAYNSLTLTSAAPWKTEPRAETAAGWKVNSYLTLMSLVIE